MKEVVIGLSPGNDQKSLILPASVWGSKRNARGH